MASLSPRKIASKTWAQRHGDQAPPPEPAGAPKWRERAPHRGEDWGKTRDQDPPRRGEAGRR